jgi:hypothetical protein
MADANPISSTVGLTILDALALTAGAAVGSIHVRPFLFPASAAGAWLMLSLVLFWIAITAAGPFIYVVHKYSRPVPGFPRTGDRLWTILGLPWVATAVVRTIYPATQEAHMDDWFTPILWACVGLACCVAGSIVWTTWIAVPSGTATQTAGPPWTNRLGLVLGVTWPLQCAASMVVAG